MEKKSRPPRPRLKIEGREPTPACFHPAEGAYTQEDCDRMFWYWNEAALDKSAGDCPSSYCTDCTPEYQAREVAAHRCCFPTVYFQRDPYDPDGLVGVRETRHKLPIGWQRVRFAPPPHTGTFEPKNIPRRMITGIRGEDE